MLCNSSAVMKKKNTQLLTHLCLAPIKGTLTNSVEPDQMLQNVASNQGLLCLQ